MEAVLYYKTETGCKTVDRCSLYLVITTMRFFGFIFNLSRIKSSEVTEMIGDFISISPLTKSAVKSQAASYFRKLLTHWLLLLVFDLCTNVEIWFPHILNAKQLRGSLAPPGQRSLQ